jgi:hypothetical protein
VFEVALKLTFMFMFMFMGPFENRVSVDVRGGEEVRKGGAKLGKGRFFDVRTDGEAKIKLRVSGAWGLAPWRASGKATR